MNLPYTRAASVLTLAALCALCASAPAAAAVTVESEDGAAGFELVGHARSFSLFTDSDLGGVQSVISQRLRPALEVWTPWGVSLEVAYDVVPVTGGAGSTAAGLAVGQNVPMRWVDFDRVAYAPESGAWVLQHNLDRLVVTYGGVWGEVRVGRQAIGFGSSRLFPAADLFAPFGPASIDTEFKRGADALRVTVPLGEFHEVEAFVVANGTDAAEWTYMGKWRGSFTGALDVAVLGGMSYGRPTLALDLTGDVLGATWYAEGSTRVDLDELSNTSVRGTLGLSYQFPFELMATVEGHYNGRGGDEPYTDELFDPSLERRVGEVFLLGRWYAGAALSYPLMPLLSASLAYQQNLTDASGLVTASLGYDFSEEVSVGLGALVTYGEEPEVDALGIPQLRSEFGAFPTIGFVDLRLVF
jgi:opacity protein-like surface antigen